MFTMTTLAPIRLITGVILLGILLCAQFCSQGANLEKAEYKVKNEPLIALAVFEKDEMSNIKSAPSGFSSTMIRGLKTRGFNVLYLNFNSFQMNVKKNHEMHERMKILIEENPNYPYYMIAEILSNPVQAANQASTYAFQAKISMAIYSSETLQMYSEKISTEGEGESVKAAEEAMVEKMQRPFHALLDGYINKLDPSKIQLITPAP